MADNLIDYQGKTVLITGAATGIGKATALAFARQGANIVIGDVDDRAKDTAADIKQLGAESLFVKTDVSDASAVENLVSEAVARFGKLDAAFNNAGLLPPTAPLAEQSAEDFDRIISVDLKGVFNCMKYEIQAMLNTGGGAIVNTASVAGVVADPGMAPYVAAKHGVVGLSRAAALDYATQGIRVNALAPGLVESNMTRRWLDDPEFVDQLMANSPVGRAAKPEEMAGMVLFLCSDAASFATGQVYLNDGGQTAH
ncbi:MAG: short chain dehydrogenase [Oceanospirillaceae bacterium]|nr:short chain dehydrogenase [Oceanospirillaceae bacterium]MBT12244.1 short chain dehydrogenase [Oceanospirillaceae bacterium]|tara:strand:+ start:14972 stop:15736 length:765 start_codon:yes stop_codon:yes gene_type:complete